MSEAVPAPPRTSESSSASLSQSAATHSWPNRQQKQGQDREVFAANELISTLRFSPLVQPTGYDSPPSFANAAAFSSQYLSERNGKQPPAAAEDMFVLQPAVQEKFIGGEQMQKQQDEGKIRQHLGAESMEHFLPPKDSVRPKLTGFIAENEKEAGEDMFVQRWKGQQRGRGQQAIVNPAAFYMQGADLNGVSPPHCRLAGCQGPVPNDSDFQLVDQQPPSSTAKTCHQTFVPLNGCFDGRGYPVGMVCQICCDCSADLAREMRKSRGWQAFIPAVQN